MAKIEKTARATVATATEALNEVAQAVKTGVKAVRKAKKAGSQAKVVAKQAVDRVSGREAARRKKGIALGAGVAATAIMTGVVASRMRKGRKH